MGIERSSYLKARKEEAKRKMEEDRLACRKNGKRGNGAHPAFAEHPNGAAQCIRGARGGAWPDKLADIDEYPTCGRSFRRWWPCTWRHARHQWSKATRLKTAAAFVHTGNGAGGYRSGRHAPHQWSMAIRLKI